MAIDMLGFALVGCFLGILTGLVPGLHVNTISLLALSLPRTNNLGLVVLIASMSIVHTFVDFLPSVLLGAPSTDTFLSILPGHRLLMKGKGLLAVKLTVVGGVFAGLGAIAISPVFLLVVEKSAGLLSIGIPFFLAAVLAAMVFGEKRIVWAIGIVSLSACLGLLALQTSLPLQQPLFCLATGFFASSMLVDSIIKKPFLKKQSEQSLYLRKIPVLRNSFLAVASGCLVSLMPGIGASQAAFLVRKAVGRIRVSEYLVLLGGVNTATMLLSFFVLFAWGKTRTGSAAAISQLSPFGLQELTLVIAACVLALGFGAIATDLLAKRVIWIVSKIDYRKVNAGVLCFVTVMVFLFSGFLGLAFYGIAGAIGLAAINSGIKRSNSMAFLMVPTIFNYVTRFV